MAGLNDRLARLSWEDLSKWASPSSVRKGRSYKGRVSGIAQTADGALLAWVQGSERYATRVGLDQEGKLLSFCSCPVGHWACKHARRWRKAAAKLKSLPFSNARRRSRSVTLPWLAVLSRLAGGMPRAAGPFAGTRTRPATCPA